MLTALLKFDNCSTQILFDNLIRNHLQTKNALIIYKTTTNNSPLPRHFGVVKTHCLFMQNIEFTSSTNSYP